MRLPDPLVDRLYERAWNERPFLGDARFLYQENHRAVVMIVMQKSNKYAASCSGLVLDAIYTYKGGIA